MSEQEEQQVFDMAKQDIPFLKHLKSVIHSDRPDFVLEDKDGRKIALEHFRADVYQVQDKNDSYISGGHTVLNDAKKELFQKYHPLAVNDLWDGETAGQAADELYELVENTIDMQSRYNYEKFIDNLHVGIHGRPPKIKGHIQKGKNYPNQESYDLKGFLIGIPVPSFRYYFETAQSQKISKIQLSLHRYPLNFQSSMKIQKQFNKGCSCQKINGLPITKEIWNELDIFEDVDFIILETYDAENPVEHHGQYFDGSTQKPHIYPAFSFGFTDISSTDVRTEHKNGETSAVFTFHVKRFEPGITTTKLKAERRKQNRKARKRFDKSTRRFRSR